MADNAMSSELIEFVKRQKDRQEIWEALLRYTRGVDRHDKELMASAYHPDSWDDHGLKAAAGSDFCDWAIGFHADIQTAHQHYITNHTVELDGDTAHAETYYIFWGDNRQGLPTLAFGRYVDRLEKRNGKWAIAYRRCITEKSGHFLEADVPPELKATSKSSRWDRHDASYARPLTRETPNGWEKDEMRAIQMNGYGGPEVLYLGDAPMPQPGSGEARVRTAAIGVNPADWKRRAGWFKDMMPLSFPHIPGSDVAGVVDAVGDGVSNLKVGDRVVLLLAFMKQGGYAEYVTAPASELVKIPADLDFATAAALPTPGLTGLQLIEEHIRPTRGQTVLVTGAVGAVGRVSLHVAKQLGARVVAAVRASQTAEARALGADEVIVLGGKAWTGAPFDAVADTVGGPEVAKLCRHVKPGGIIVTVSTTPIEPTGLPSQPVFVALHNDAGHLARLVEAVSGGRLPFPIAKRLPLAQAAEAQRLVETGGQGGKIVLVP